MASIVAGNTSISLINIFSISAAKADELVDLLNKATSEVMIRQPGFVSANIHRSLDGTRVANYAQWRSRADFDAMQENPECREHMARAAALADHFEPVLYKVVSVHEV